MITQGASADISQAASDWFEYISNHVEMQSVSPLLEGLIDDSTIQSVNANTIKVEYHNVLVGHIENANLGRWQTQGVWKGSDHPVTLEFESQVTNPDHAGGDDLVRCHVEGSEPYLARVLELSNDRIVIRRQPGGS